MNGTQRNYGSSEVYLPILREAMVEELFLFLRKLQSGPVDLSEPLALASRSGGLVGDPRDSAMAIIDAVQCACLQWEAISRANKDRTTIRERLDERQAAIEKMYVLARQLEADTWKIERIQGSFDQSNAERLELARVVNAIRDTASAIDLFTERQRQLIHYNGGNRKGFDHLFVPKMRSVWTKITGQEPGVAKAAVVRFSESVWLVFGFEPRRPRPLFPWLSERFSKIR